MEEWIFISSLIALGIKWKLQVTFPTLKARPVVYYTGGFREEEIFASAGSVTSFISCCSQVSVLSCCCFLDMCISVVPKVGGTAPWGAVGLPRWALIGTRGRRERCYYHRGALVDK
jgi:hypothetical protein